MNVTLRRAVGAAVGTAVLLSVAVRSASAQPAGAALRDRVNQLVERLGAPEAEARQAAEEALIKLGPRMLPILPESTGAVGAEREERLERIRTSLREAGEPSNLDAARVTIQGSGIRLSEALRQLQQQSGNVIKDLRDESGGEATNPALDLDIVDRPFLQALDELADRVEAHASFYTEDGTIGLMAGAAPGRAMVQYQGPFRIAFKQLGLQRDFEADAARANAQWEVAWEPRIRPMLLALKAEELEIVDDRGESVAPQVTKETSQVVLRPDNPFALLNLNLECPDRAARALARVKVKAEVTAPAGVRTFRFPSLAQRDVTRKAGDISVTLESAEAEDFVWKVNVELAYPDGGPAFESFQQGLFNNRLWLQKADGSRFEHNGGFSNTAAEGGKIGFEYLFVDAPGSLGDYGLVYEAPSRVQAIPLEFEFKDVPLP